MPEDGMSWIGLGLAMFSACGVLIVGILKLPLTKRYTSSSGVTMSQCNDNRKQAKELFETKLDVVEEQIKNVRGDTKELKTTTSQILKVLLEK